MGTTRPGGNARRTPNATAYFVALAGILVLLVALCCYFLYFCITRVKELTRELPPHPTATPRPAAPSTTTSATYPVQQGVRDSATAMAKLCAQVPGNKGAAVFPAYPSKDALQDSIAVDPPKTIAPVAASLSVCQPPAVR